MCLSANSIPCLGLLVYFLSAHTPPQINWMRYLSSMRTPAHFGRSVNAAAGLMLAVFLATAAICYARLGVDFDHTVPITSLLPQVCDEVLQNATTQKPE